ncbi:deoxycytidylate deaminase-like [Tribolium madens]|uniref:deoxycytidylate deaminase-like n=1 Tax=Tribolium madens TaxID=41895 RepID=UPI001CF71F16|nr:deoxycytidylate deaminase-like [Tribolium madens]
MTESDQKIMAFCKMESENSKDQKRKVGACVINDQGRMIGWGFNNMPRGIEGFDKYWDSKSEKLLCVCHAELNAIAMCKGPLNNAKLYCTTFPCHNCAQLIVQSGIKQVFYATNLGKGWRFSASASKQIFRAAQIEVKEVAPSDDPYEEIEDFIRPMKDSH